MLNSVKDNIKNSVKPCKINAFNTLDNGVKSVNLTEELSDSMRDTLYIQEITPKKKECLTTVGLILLLLVLRYLQQVSWRIQLLLLVSTISYALYRDILNIALWLSNRSRAYLSLATLFIVCGICSIGMIPIGIIICLIALALILMKSAMTYNDIYMMSEAADSRKEIRNERERQERYIAKIEKKLAHYERLDTKREQELAELKETTQDYELELSQLKIHNHNLAEDLKAEQTYNHELESINYQLKSQIETLEQMAAEPHDKLLTSQDDIVPIGASSDNSDIAHTQNESNINISDRDRRILNYLNNTNKSLREIATLIGCSHVTVKNVKEKYANMVS